MQLVNLRRRTVVYGRQTVKSCSIKIRYLCDWLAESSPTALITFKRKACKNESNVCRFLSQVRRVHFPLILKPIFQEFVIEFSPRFIVQIFNDHLESGIIFDDSMCRLFGAALLPKSTPPQ
ncbi:Siderophore peptide synthetase fer3 [Trichinella spiralis]|uniref:Siderophore peptide synthetase fer3 n=1 Tax=Trichinella spiralis TaxID=6334 RepID=A0ABR3KPD1_TRISP